MWILFAFGSAFFAGITAILTKCGIKKNGFGCRNSGANYYCTYIFVAYGSDCRLCPHNFNAEHKDIGIFNFIGTCNGRIVALLYGYS